jgi:hypothetical protein
VEGPATPGFMTTTGERERERERKKKKKQKVLMMEVHLDLLAT